RGREAQEVLGRPALPHRLQEIGHAARAAEGVQRGVEQKVRQDLAQPRQQTVLAAHEAQLRKGAGAVGRDGDGAKRAHGHHMVPPAGALAGPGGGGTLPPMSRRAVRVPLLRNLTLKTKLLLMMLSLLVLSVSSLFLLHLYNERQLLSQLREY